MSTLDREYNLQFIKKSRLKRGDIFTLHIGKDYLFGRIVNDKIPMIGSHVALVYVYNARSSEPKVDVAELTPDNLLVSPFISLPVLWTHGYAAKMGFEPVGQHNVLRYHYFLKNGQKYVDEFGKATEKLDNNYYCGVWRITSLGIIDDWISDALGIKRMPLKEKDIWYISGNGEKIWTKYPITELKKYANYEEIIKKYPEVIEP